MEDIPRDILETALDAFLLAELEGTVEAIARAILDERKRCAKEARAAIESMREPTEAMVEAAAWEDGSVTARNVWRLMIDEALKE